MTRDGILAACLEEYARLQASITRERADELRMTAAPERDRRDYAAQPEWARRQEIRIRAAGGRCQLCGVSGRQLQAHHVNYDAAGMEEFSDLTALCEECHALATRFLPHLRWGTRSRGYVHPDEATRRSERAREERKLMDL